MKQYAGAEDDIARAFAHQHVVAADVRLALGAVEQQSQSACPGGAAQLRCRGKYRAAEPDDSSAADDLAQLFGRELFERRRRSCRMTLVAAVVRHDDAERGSSEAMRRGSRLDCRDSSRRRRMQPRADRPARLRDRLSPQNPLTRLDQRHRGRACMLIERQDERFDRARRAQSVLGRALLVSIESQAAAQSGSSHRSCTRRGPHHDAIDGAGWNAQLATGALRGNDGVHEAARSDDRIHGARLNAFHAADARRFVDPGDGGMCRHTAEARIDRARLTTKELCECSGRCIAAGRALIDVRFAVRERSRVRTAT